MATCNSCDAAIIWATSKKTGKPMPIDAAPSEKGNLYIERKAGDFVVRAATEEDKKLHRELHVSHFATCPQAAGWRK